MEGGPANTSLTTLVISGSSSARQKPPAQQEYKIPKAKRLQVQAAFGKRKLAERKGFEGVGVEGGFPG